MSLPDGDRMKLTAELEAREQALLDQAEQRRASAPGVDVDELARKHERVRGSAVDWCREDEQEWPCQTMVLVTEIQRLRESAATTRQVVAQEISDAIQAWSGKGHASYAHAAAIAREFVGAS